MARNRGIAFKLSARIIGAGAVIFVLMFGYSYHLVRSIILEQASENAHALGARTVNTINSTLATAEALPTSLAAVLEGSRLSEPEIGGLLRAAVERSREAYGSCIAFEPHAFDPSREFFAPYAFRKDGPVSYKILGGDDYRYTTFDWYQIPKELDEPAWTEPYFDEGGGEIMMTTFGVPFHESADPASPFRGIATVDLSLESLRDALAAIKIKQTGFVFLISASGRFVYHPRKGLVRSESIFSLAEGRGDPKLRALGRLMIAGKTGFVPSGSIVEQGRSWIYFTPVEAKGWSLGVVYPEAELFADVTRLKWIGFSLGGAGLALLLLITISISRSITRPLRALSAAADRIASGNLATPGTLNATMRLVVSEASALAENLDINSPIVQSGDEVGRLAKAFIHMQSSLQEYIRNLRQTTAAKERIESELQIAREIQMSILPKIFPPFPHRNDLDLFAAIEPAKEVGGDFYDFVLTPDGRIWFAIGDVSGKGVPASLFMAITRTLLKVVAADHDTPDAILHALNLKLCGDNDSGMFVTLFLGILDTATGEVIYANGGHNPPRLIRAGGALETLSEGRGRALGVLEDSVFKQGRCELRPGDAIFLYTDGVTEAMESTGALFGEPRMDESLRRNNAATPRDLIKALHRDVKAFAGPTAQSDDITTLALKYFGKGESKEPQTP